MSGKEKREVQLSVRIEKKGLKNKVIEARDEQMLLMMCNRLPFSM